MKIGDRVTDGISKGTLREIRPEGHRFGRPMDTHLVTFDRGGWSWGPEDRLRLVNATLTRYHALRDMTEAGLEVYPRSAYGGMAENVIRAIDALNEGKTPREAGFTFGDDSPHCGPRGCTP